MRAAAICGGRDRRPSNRSLGIARLELADRKIDRVLHGGCPTGVDPLVSAFLARFGLLVEPVPADWSLGRRAGPLRNQEMAERICLLLAWPGGRGTADMVRRCERLGVEIVRMDRD